MDAVITETADVLLLVITGAIAGAINAAVGSGSLLTYPALLSLGLPPVVANGTNSLGVVPGALAGAWSYRESLRQGWQALRPRIVAVAAGGLVGAGLVVFLPSEVFDVVVPWLILAACGVIAVAPVVIRKLKPHKRSRRAGIVTMGLLGIYGGYFGAGQGIAQLAALTVLDGADIQRANAQKNVLSATANFSGAVVFAVAGYVAWLPALIICVSSLAGGYFGGEVAKRLPATVLRIVILAVGLYAAYLSFRGWS